MGLIRKYVCVHFFIYLTFVTLVAQETGVAKLYLINGSVVEGIIEEVSSETVRFNYISDDCFQLVQTVPIRMIYKLISPLGEEIINNHDFKFEFEQNLARQDFIKQAAQIENDCADVIERTQGEIHFAGLNVGIGGGSVGISIGGDLNYRVTARLISQVSLVHSETFEVFGGTPEESVTSLALLVGMRTIGEHSVSAILIGVGAVNGFHQGRFLRCDNGGGFLCFGGIYEKNSFKTIGLVGNIQFYWMPSSIFGIGANITGNINSETSFVAALLSLRFGS